MKFIPTELEGAWIIETVRHGDARGYFCETFRQSEFEAAVGRVCFVQENESRSHRGVIRGLHYQRGSHAQAKLVRVSRGAIIDVVVDLRQSSPTYGRHITVELTEDNGRQLFVPRGFAHGFVVLADDTTFHYKVDNYYCPEAEAGITPLDPKLGISWPDLGNGIIINDRDRNAPSFDQAEKFE